MRYKKVYPRTSLKTVDVLAVDGALNIGCLMTNGKLVPAINSVTRLDYLVYRATGAWYAEGPKKHFLFAQNRLFFTDSTIENSTMVNFKAQSPCMVEVVTSQGPTAYVIGDTVYLYAVGATCGTKTFSGAVYSCVPKNGRIFGIDNADPYKIKWSGEGGIDDWEEGISGAGWTIVQHDHGEILNLIVYKDKIVAVRKQGLTFLSAHGTPENYKLNYLESKLPTIYKNTAVVVGAHLIFYTEDGLYFYDGIKVGKCQQGLAEEIQSPTQACCVKGKYFLCGKSKELNKKVILVYDVIRNLAYLIDAAVNNVTAGEVVYAYSEKYEFRLEEGGEYTFTSGNVDFSSSGIKVLKEVILDGAKDAKVEVSNGVISRIVGGVRGKFRPNMRGKSFKITVSGSGKLNGISAVAEVTNEV